MATQETMATAKNTKLAFAEIEALTAAALIELYRDTAIKPSKSVSTAREKVVENVHTASKSVAAMKRLYTKRWNAHDIPQDTTEKKFFEDNGGDVPPRVKSVASFFNATVLTMDGNGKPLLTEEHFDMTSVASLEKAASILKDVKKECAKDGADYRFAEGTLDLLNILNKPSEENPKKLRDLAKRLRGTDETEDRKSTRLNSSH